MTADEARELYNKITTDPKSVDLPQEVKDFIDNWIRCNIINYNLRHFEIHFDTSKELEYSDLFNTRIMMYLKRNPDKVVEYAKSQGFSVDMANTNGTHCYIHIEW